MCLNAPHIFATLAVSGLKTLTHYSGPAHSRNLQWLDCQAYGNRYTIMNHHGLWNAQGKYDSPARLEQSRRISEFVKTRTLPAILCGYFNLRPDTQSLQMIATGMQNLISDYQIQSTRTSYYPKAEKFADYVFATPQINVENFKVLPNEVSDHAPIVLEFT